MGDSTVLDDPGQAVEGVTVRQSAAVLGGVGGCLLLVVWASPGYLGPVSPYVQGPWTSGAGEVDLAAWSVTALVTGAALWVPRWWPHLLVMAGALTVMLCSDVVGAAHTRVVTTLSGAAFALSLVAVLQCAQGLARSRPGWAAVVAGSAIGARLLGAALTGATWLVLPGNLRAWHLSLALLGLGMVLAAAWWLRSGDPSAADPPAGDGTRGRSWPRARPVIAVMVALAAAVAVSYLTGRRLAGLLGVSVESLARHPAAQTAVVGAVTVAVAVVAAAVAGLWMLGGALTAATVQVAVAAPLLLAVAALALQGPARLLGALAGLALGLLAAATRWRMALAGGLAVAAAVVVFIAYGATGGHPEKLAAQQSVIPGSIIMVLVVATATCVVGATAPQLSRRGLLPAASGPLAAVLAVGGLQTVNITYLHDGLTESSYLSPATHLTSSAVLFLVAGAAVGVFGFAQQMASTRGERRSPS